MNDEELQQRLRRIDPAAGMSIDPVHGPRAAALMEQIMNTPTHIEDPAGSARPVRRWPRFALAGAAALALAGVGVVALGGNDDDSESATSVRYSLAAFDPMAMCLMVSEQVPAPGTVAFRGTVGEVGDATVTLDVADWFGADGTDQVVLSLADAGSPALDGVEFAAGGEYLVAVTDGVVQTCGMSGQASPELEALYAGWFGS
ncbi:MAG: hypothetical protein ABMA25_05970 [Ilumatobacteraceae bacterium]